MACTGSIMTIRPLQRTISETDDDILCLFPAHSPGGTSVVRVIGEVDDRNAGSVSRYQVEGFGQLTENLRPFLAMRTKKEHSSELVNPIVV